MTPLAVYLDLDELGADDGRTLLEEAGWEVAERRCRGEQDVIDAGTGATALLVAHTPITRRVIEQLPELRIVAVQAVGFDTVDTAAAGEAGVWVSNVPDAASEEVATHALALALALLRQLPAYQAVARAGGWTYTDDPPPRRAGDVAIGIAGLGRIGRLLAGMATGVFGRRLGFDPLLDRDRFPSGVSAVATVEELFERSHVVSLHMPLVPETEGIVGERLLARMQPGSYLVNVSRGGLVQPAALLAALESGRLAGAGLDVMEHEPPDPADPLLAHPRALVTPHVAFLSRESPAAYLRLQAENVLAWQASGRPRTPVVSPPSPRR